MTSSNRPTLIAVIGGGVIGGGWVARGLLNGIDVTVFDPDPAAPRKIDDIMHNARLAFDKLIDGPVPPQGQLVFAKTIAAAVASADIIIEAVPERLDIKQSVYREIESAAAQNALIASSTSGILPSDLQDGMTHPERLLVAHPFNPVYLLPLVEIVGGTKTSSASIDRAMALFQTIGMHPLHVRTEIPAFIADRFLEAVWREALWLVNDGVATTAEIDDAIRYGFGLRWAQMGLFETYRVAGGEAGMAHFIAQFGPCLQWPWTKLTDVPELTDALVTTIADQSDAQSGAHSIRQLEQIRDDNLVAILTQLKLRDWGAGQAVSAWQDQLKHSAAAAHPAPAPLIRSYTTTVPDTWVDYNGHMTEHRYLECFSNATDEIMRQGGVDDAYIAAGGSYFTVETHIRHSDEVLAGEPIYVDTQIIDVAGKTMHLFHTLYHHSGRQLATGEHMLLHVDMTARRASPPSQAVAAKLAAMARAHAGHDRPQAVGRAIGMPRTGAHQPTHTPNH
jgi:carnitine 3-dehydrogenase